MTGLLAGWHYRICAPFTNPAKGARNGLRSKDAVFNGSKKATKLKFVLPKGKEERLSVVYGGTLELAGSLSGTQQRQRGLALQATPVPVHRPVHGASAARSSPSRTGTFVFRSRACSRALEFRILTTDPSPTYSPTVTVHVTPRITLHVRSAGKTGLYRIYGTVAPARPGSAADDPAAAFRRRPQSKREGPAPHAVSSTTLKKATKSLSRFSVIVSLSGTFHYRAFVRLPEGRRRIRAQRQRADQGAQGHDQTQTP